MTKFIDSHCYLADAAFAGVLDVVIERAKQAGLERTLVILEAGHVQEAAQAQRVSELWPETRLAIGVHPHIAHQYADDPDRSAAVVAAQADATPGARAIGEIGLDYHYDHSPRDLQQRVFRAQLRLALQRRLPVVIHTREAEADTLTILREEQAEAFGGVLHCFTGSLELAREALTLGFYVSAAGIVTFPKAEALRATFREIPLDRTLTETDSPFLAPVPHRGGRNEPAHVARVVDALAHLHDVPVEHVAARTGANFHSLFRP